MSSDDVVDGDASVGEGSGARGAGGDGPPIRIVIADDHSGFRAGVRSALEGNGFTVVGEAADGASALEVALRERPDLCLLDINMPRGGGIAAAGEITSKLPDTAIVMLTVSRNDDDLFNALKAGAAGYLLKDTDPKRLPLALRGVLQGEAALPRSLMAKVMEEFRERGRDRHRAAGSRLGAALSTREWEVLDFMRQGLSTRQIAQKTFVAEGTVRNHVSAILRKLKVTSRDDAVQLFAGESPDRAE